eukprot:CAMPEP_0172700064 /NCGR_PEP_ID=MMETSP1074-20121228/30635_1 /TAXON_ID=2916 /ORGANISM="Ceratium fusus, Strain PA161109" /LENGTH=125 /DNA_ID=CAMNT_0013521375 /DNA_START=72 /DNA_END=449 /DNA_ORIENTATION=-
MSVFSLASFSYRVLFLCCEELVVGCAVGVGAGSSDRAAADGSSDEAAADGSSDGAAADGSCPGEESFFCLSDFPLGLADSCVSRRSNITLSAPLTKRTYSDLSLSRIISTTTDMRFLADVNALTP